MGAAGTGATGAAGIGATGPTGTGATSPATAGGTSAATGSVLTTTATGDSTAAGSEQPGAQAEERSKLRLPFTGIELWRVVLSGAILLGGGLGVRRLLAG